MIALYIALGVIALLVLYVMVAYNGLVKLRNRVKNGWAQIDTQLQRRMDLIPNLVETVKGYAEHEKELFEQVAAARSGMMNAQSVAEKASADNVLTGTLKTLFAVSENYPELKANVNFLNLQEELATTENKIAFARQFYNDIAMKFNTAIELFPKNIIANMFNFKAVEFFKADEAAKTPPKVSFK